MKRVILGLVIAIVLALACTPLASAKASTINDVLNSNEDGSINHASLHIVTSPQVPYHEVNQHVITNYDTQAGMIIEHENMLTINQIRDEALSNHHVINSVYEIGGIEERAHGVYQLVNGDVKVDKYWEK